MDTTEKIVNAIEWANKRLSLIDTPLNETQKSYIVFALRSNFSEDYEIKEAEELRIKLTNKTKTR